MRARVIACVAACAWAAAWLIACATASPPARGRRVVVVAAEGASWPLAASLASSGAMPHLAALLRDGSMGMVRAPEPLSPAVVWTTLATGRPREEHGIPFDAVKAPGSQELRPVTADRRRAPALWSVATGHGLTVGVAGWPATWPAEEVKGFLIADTLAPGVAAARGDIHPPGALGAGGEDGDGLPLPDALREAAGLDPVVREAFSRDLATLSRVTALQRVHQPRLLMLRLSAIDAVSHRLWQYHDPRYLDLAVSRGEIIPAADAARLAPAVAAAYRFLDHCLGRLQERLPPETALLVVSGWGMRGVRMTDYLHVDLDRLLRLLAEAGEAVALRMVALPDTGNTPRGIYLQGARGAATAFDTAGIARLAEALRALGTPDGVPLFRRVVASPGAPEGEPVLEVEENLDIDPEGSISPGGAPMQVRDLFRRYGDAYAIHDAQGWAVAAGDGIAAGRKGWSAGILDIAPTVLTLLGLPVAQDMPGHPIETVLAAPSGDPAGRIETYQGIRPPPAPARRDEAAARRELERLRRAGHLN